MSAKVQFRHGPEGTPFRIAESGTALDAKGGRPFHGIIARALLERVRSGEPFPVPWDEIGHRLECDPDDTDPSLEPWRRAALGAGVLCYAQSAKAARAYAERLAEPARLAKLTGCLVADTDQPEIVLWNVKEGHTSSVWNARFAANDGHFECAINVARDALAGQELKRTSEVLQAICAAWPDLPVAHVRDIASVVLPDIAEPVVVTCNDWIADARELHRLPPQDDGCSELMVAVERFVADEMVPGRIVRIHGQRLSPEEAGRVEADLAHFLHCGAAFGVEIELNDGDLVWNGEHATVVAIN